MQEPFLSLSLCPLLPWTATAIYCTVLESEQHRLPSMGLFNGEIFPQPKAESRGVGHSQSVASGISTYLTSESVMGSFLPNLSYEGKKKHI